MNSTELAADSATVDPSPRKNEAPVGHKSSSLSRHRLSDADELQGRFLLPSIEGTKDVVERSDNSGLLKAVAACKQYSDYDCVPAELLDALRKTSRRPLTQHQKKSACPPPSNVWNFPQRRAKLKHLTDNPPSLSGAGKDISFLHDVNTTDQQSPTEGFQLPDTLIPEEYHIVKHPGILGLEIHDNCPAGRKETTALRNVMEDMLERAGVDGTTADPEGPTQMHRLCELVKQEQAIYNLVFHELIRQISVQCSERGQLLALLRQKYAGLLDRIPRQVKGLHDEVLAQRALDRRVTAELNRFQAAISRLTDELHDVQQHDTEVTEQACEARQKLEDALVESEKNASIVAEYHDLYEMQRHRLELQVTQLVNEKELWHKAAHSLAAKVAHQRNLKTSQRLHLSEKAWCKLAAHFAVVLSDRDTQQLSELQNYIQTFHDMMLAVRDTLVKQDEAMQSQLAEILTKMHQWQHHISLWVAEGSDSIDAVRMKELWVDMKLWEEKISIMAEKFTGDSVLDWQEKLANISKQVEGWTETAIVVFNRHKVSGDSEDQREEKLKMHQLNDTMETCLKQLHIRVTGENGLAKILIHLVNPLERWSSKLNVALSGTQALPSSEWQKLAEQLDDWVNHIETAVQRVGLHVKGNVPIKDETQEVMCVDALLKDAVRWMKTTCNSIDNEDRTLVEQVTVLHSDMVGWMVQVLLCLTEEEAEDEAREGDEARQRDEGPVGDVEEDYRMETENDREPLKSTADIKTAQNSLTLRLNLLTNKLNKCCAEVLQDQLQAMLGLAGEEGAEMELRDLKRMVSECEQWIQGAELLVGDLIAKDAGQWIAPSQHELRKTDPLARKQQKSLEKIDLNGKAEEENTETLSVQVIGLDKNVSEKPIESVVIEKDATTGPSSPSVEALSSDAPLPPGQSGSPHNALLSAIESLEQQLKESQAKAATAEERASKAEEKLRVAHEQIDTLEQQEQKLQQEIRRHQQQFNQQSPRRGQGPPSRGPGGRQSQGSKRTPIAQQQQRRSTPDVQGSSSTPGSRK